MDWLTTDSNNAKWGLAMTQIGGEDLGGGLFVPIYIFLANGWRIRPMESSHHFTLTGNLFVAEGGSPIVNTLGNFNVIAQFTVPVQAQAMAISGGSGLTPTQATQLEQVNKVLLNNKELKDNQLTVYDNDKTTPLFTWSLKNKQGLPTENQVYKSELV
jgi:hypothetical protein